MPHIHDKIDFVVNAWIVHKGRVLLIFHKGQQMWLPIGGHIELDEDPEKALFREIKEECGLEVELVGTAESSGYPEGDGRKLLSTPAYLDIHPITNTHRHIALEYFVKAKADAVCLAEDEHDKIRWFTEAELDDPQFGVAPDVIFFAKEALRRIT